MNDEKAIRMAELSSKFMQEIWEILKDHTDESATEVDLFSCLLSTQTIAEAICMRLRNMNVEEELIELAIANAKNQIIFILEEKKGLFYMKGEEV